MKQGSPNLLSNNQYLTGEIHNNNEIQKNKGKTGKKIKSKNAFPKTKNKPEQHENGNMDATRLYTIQKSILLNKTL